MVYSLALIYAYVCVGMHTFDFLFVCESIWEFFRAALALELQLESWWDG